jgi:hypothetical protein
MQNIPRAGAIAAALFARGESAQSVTGGAVEHPKIFIYE